MRNNKNEYEKCLFLGIEHRKSMRNANFSKYFSYSITLCFNRLTDIHENMRNRIAKSGSSSNLVVISFLFQLSSSFLILLKVVDMFAF
ncbi:hypothetical protein HMPREF9010_01993 [Bacteroides sp. 3_1_23]|nr:hypothetical protein HMPREF9010_01993 [Bacteroides sp. 3_1_23]